MGTGYVRNDTSNNIADGNVINASDLDGEFAMGFCQDNYGEFLIHVHNGLDIR